MISTMGGGPWGASEELWAATVDEALGEGHNVLVSVYKWADIPAKLLKIQLRGAQVVRRNVPFVRSRRLDKLIRKFKSQFESVSDFNPDVILISQGGTYDSVYFPDLLDLLFESRIPYVVLCNANSLVLGSGIRDVANVFLDRASRIGFFSAQSKKTAERQLARELPNAVILQNPVNLSDLAALAWPPAGTIRMASVARLDIEYKGQDVLFEALGSTQWRSRDWHLSLYGDGPDLAYLEGLAKFYGISERVRFRGFVDDIRAVWLENHLPVVSSRSETVPLVLVEAMLCGRPPVTTDVGIAPDWVVEQATGFVAEAPTAKSIGAALERAWSAREDWERMGTQARENALAQLDRSPGRTLLNLLQGVAADVHQ